MQEEIPGSKMATQEIQQIMLALVVKLKLEMVVMVNPVMVGKDNMVELLLQPGIWRC